MCISLLSWLTLTTHMYLSGPKTEQLRTEEEHTGWHGGDKKQRKVFRSLHFQTKILLIGEGRGSLTLHGLKEK